VDVDDAGDERECSTLVEKASNADVVPPAHPAATVVVLRQRDGEGMQVLMLHKNTGHAFGDMWVFPGGRVDPSDGADGDSEHDCARNAAVREAREETGMELSADDLVAFAHWTPPPESPRRFATWFFLADSPADVGDVRVDGAEIVVHSWISANDALGRHARREIQLAAPTWVTLHGLARWSVPLEAVEAARAQAVAYFATRLVEVNDTRVALWADDAGYLTGDVTSTGARHRLVMTRSGPWSYERTS
jgi:8-oxo-dGTP pyrophosphatase MutT (NUDIX family)